MQTCLTCNDTGFLGSTERCLNCHTYTHTIEKIKNNDVYKEVMADSFGGVMYNVANQDKYNSGEILELWGSMTPAEKESADGIMNGAMQFLQGN